MLLIPKNGPYKLPGRQEVMRASGITAVPRSNWLTPTLSESLPRAWTAYAHKWKSLSFSFPHFQTCSDKFQASLKCILHFSDRCVLSVMSRTRTKQQHKRRIFSWMVGAWSSPCTVQKTRLNTIRQIERGIAKQRLRMAAHYLLSWPTS